MGRLTAEGLEGRERYRAGFGVPWASPKVSLLFGLLSFSEGSTGVPDRARTGAEIVCLQKATGVLVKVRAAERRSALRAGATGTAGGVPIPSRSPGPAWPRRSTRRTASAPPMPWLPLLSVQHPSSDRRCKLLRRS